MKQLLNLSLGDTPGHLFQHWKQAREWLNFFNLDGYEVAPYQTLHTQAQPMDIIGGVHLSFFPFLEAFWRQSPKLISQHFGHERHMLDYFNCQTPDQLVDYYCKQLDLAQAAGVSYVVFHPVVLSPLQLFDTSQQPTPLQSANLLAELLNQVFVKMSFNGYFLLENLWWPSGMCLNNRQDYELFRQQLNYDKVGICFDSGHFMAGRNFSDEKQAIATMLTHLKQHDLIDEIHTLHLNASFGSHHWPKVLPVAAENFWGQLQNDIEIISHIDPHQAFTSGEQWRLVEAVEPNCLVHELQQQSLLHWGAAISQQLTGRQESLTNMHNCQNLKIVA
ncbi:TIM barrel protein [Shewanella sp. TC10]|uniref:TIM barrel protein n=1 Tax=Shewanella sp. TC10 TaxID=1419739 RepID=UPI00129DA702|nr:TIM barrel protein [Shewanella sp. TC10]